MAPPPFLVLDGYRDTDREGKDYTKPGAQEFKKTEYYQYVIPVWRGYLMDSYQRQGSNCAFFEAQYYRCMEAFGVGLARLYCDLEQRDLTECVTNEKKTKRYQAMKDIRFKKWLRGDRKTFWEPTADYLLAVKPDFAAMATGGDPKRKPQTIK